MAASPGFLRRDRTAADMIGQRSDLSFRFSSGSVFGTFDELASQVLEPLNLPTALSNSASFHASTTALTTG
jgi:hypothetical protein